MIRPSFVLRALAAIDPDMCKLEEVTRHVSHAVNLRVLLAMSSSYKAVSFGSIN